MGGEKREVNEDEDLITLELGADGISLPLMRFMFRFGVPITLSMVLKRGVSGGEF
jgi:hypothetical protein